MRDRLIELLQSKKESWEYLLCKSNIEALADYLLANGVIVPPCKVGDTVWRISKNGKYVYDTDVTIVFCDKDGVYFETIQNDVFEEDDIGKTVFPTKEEAEAELRKRGKDNV